MNLKPGSHKFDYNDANQSPEKPVTVWYHKPEKMNSDTRVIFIMPGLKRNGKEALDIWAGLTGNEKFLLLVPEFTMEHYPRMEDYILGNMVSVNGKTNDQSEWTFSIIEKIFDVVVDQSNLSTSDYIMFGHSAGAQFVHRMLMFIPNARVEMAIAANAGFYTMPRFDVDFPYGLQKSAATPAGLSKAFSKKLIVLLGTADNDPNHKYLRNTPETIAQGKHRFERGHNFFDLSKSEAAASGIDFLWQLKTVANVGHDKLKMSEFALKIIA
jgi:poly(3-hydroxybutyrate) depolymerase